LEDKIIEHRKLVKEANAVASHWLEVSCEDFEITNELYNRPNLSSEHKAFFKKLMDENNREFYFYCNQCFKPLCENMKEVYKDEYTRNINIKRIYTVYTFVIFVNCMMIVLIVVVIRMMMIMKNVKFITCHMLEFLVKKWHTCAGAF